MPSDFSWGILLLTRKVSLNNSFCYQKSSGHNPARAGVSAEVCSLAFHSSQAPQFCWTKSSRHQILFWAALETPSPGSDGYSLVLLPAEIRLSTESPARLGREKVLVGSSDENINRNWQEPFSCIERLLNIILPGCLKLLNSLWFLRQGLYPSLALMLLNLKPVSTVTESRTIGYSYMSR